MATMNFTVSDLTLTSYWFVRKTSGELIDPSGGPQPTAITYATVPVIARGKRTFSLAGFPSGSIIHSASLSATRSGPSGQARQVDGRADSGALSIEASRITPGGTLEIDFLFKASGTLKSTLGYYEESAVWKNITLSVEYTGYTACKAPTKVALNRSTALPSDSLTLSWSGAKAGLNVPISGYEIHRATAAEGPYSLLKSVGASVLSAAVSAPASAGSYHFKVKAVGGVSGYSSALSAASAEVAVSVTAPGAPTQLALSPASQYPEGQATLSWAASPAGTNNPVTGYRVYRADKANGAFASIGTVSGTSKTVTAPQSGAYYYKVKALGQYLDSPLSAASPALKTDMSGTSDFSVSPDRVDAGTQMTVALSGNLDKAHTLTVQIGSYSDTVQSEAGADVILFTPPLAWLNALPDSESAPMTVKVRTAGGGTVIKQVPLRCPSSVKPTGMNGSVSPYSTVVPSGWGVYVHKKSAAQVTFDTAASAPYGASIAFYAIDGPGMHVEGASLPLTGVSALLSSGENTFTLTATDSRGHKGTRTLTVTVLPYAKPTLKNILSLRADAQGEESDEGTWVHSTATIKCSACGGHNSAACAVAYRRQGTDAWTQAGSLSDGSLLFGGSIAINRNWDVRYTVTDTLGNSNVYYDVVTHVVWEMHIKRGGGAWAFGGVADTAGALHVYGGMKLDTPLPVASGGTGATTVKAARNALGLGDTSGALPIANGGTGATTVKAARNALGLGNTSGALPIDNGGTGAATVDAARENLGLDGVEKGVFNYAKVQKVTDLNDAVGPGFFRYESSAANKPYSAGGALVVVAYSTSIGTQIACPYISGSSPTAKLYIRHYNSNGFGAWVTVK